MLVGTSTGDFLAFDSLSLQKLCCVKVAAHPITTINIEPAQAVFVGIRNTKEVVMLTFIERKEKYVYIELENKKYCTLVLKNGMT